MARGSMPTAPVDRHGKQVGGQVARPMVAVPRGSMEVAVVILVLTQLMLAIGGGAAVGLPAGDVLTQTRGWGWVMFVNVPIGILVLIGALRHLPELPRQGTSPAPRPRP